MKCALCDKETDLTQSHIIPKLVYRRIRSNKNLAFDRLMILLKYYKMARKDRCSVMNVKNYFVHMKLSLFQIFWMII